MNKDFKKKRNVTLSWIAKNDQGQKVSKLITELDEKHLENILMSLGRNKRDQYINGVSRVTYIVGITEELSKRRHEKHMETKESDQTINTLKDIFPNMEAKGFEEVQESEIAGN